MRQGPDSEGPFGSQVIDLVTRQFQQEADAMHALNFLQTVAANLDNEKLDDATFRQFMRNSMAGMPGVGYEMPIPVKVDGEQDDGS